MREDRRRSVWCGGGGGLMVLKQSLVGAFISEPFIFSERASLSLNPFALRSALKNALSSGAPRSRGGLRNLALAHIDSLAQLSLPDRLALARINTARPAKLFIKQNYIRKNELLHVHAAHTALLWIKTVQPETINNAARVLSALLENDLNLCWLCSACHY
jgi:hypothetical protein